GEVRDGGLRDGRMAIVATSAPPVGLIAGAGRFPVVFAEKARAMGHQVYCVGLKNLAPDELRAIVSEFRPVGIAKMGAIMRTFHRWGVKRIVMAGKVNK